MDSFLLSNKAKVWEKMWIKFKQGNWCWRYLGVLKNVWAKLKCCLNELDLSHSKAIKDIMFSKYGSTHRWRGLQTLKMSDAPSLHWNILISTGKFDGFWTFDFIL